MNIFAQLVGLIGRGITPTQGLCLHRTTQHDTKTRTHTSTPRMGLESTIPVSERSKTACAWDRAAIGTDIL